MPMIREKLVTEIRNSGFDFLTVDECAVIAKCSVVTIYRYIKDGSLQATRVAGGARIRREVFLQFMARPYC
jgi:excisionase family DNA binding protein